LLERPVASDLSRMNAPPFVFPSADHIAAAKQELAASADHLFIDGEFVAASDGATLDVENPASGEHLAQVASAGVADVDAAVRAAHRALHDGPWATMPATERAALLWRLADAIEADAHDFALIETLDNGMPYAQALMAAVPMAVDALRYNSGWATKLGGETLPSGAPGEWFSYTLRQPVGVVAAIAAWNFPLSMACGKLAPALAAGCTIVLKPAEQAPLSAVRLARIVQQVGFPKGVINILPGLGSVAGQALVDHPLVRKITFTGSTAVGKAILRASANDLKRVTLELGGKSPAVVFGDADLGPAIEAAAMGVFFNTGQICVARSRLFVEETVYDEVVEGVAGFIRNLKVGDGLEPGSMLGPVISRAQLERIESYISGAAPAAGGRRIGDRGYFIEPTLFTGLDPDSPLAREEIFGPVVVAVPFKRGDLDAVASAANDTSYGLAASIFTRDLSTAHRLARRIDAGLIEINGGAPMQFSLPFGGFKQSGLGRENGREGVEAFTELKSVSIRLA